MSLSIATVPGAPQSESLQQMAEGWTVELNSSTPAAVQIDLNTVNPGLRADAVSIVNNSGQLVRVTLRDNALQPLGFGLNANGMHLISPGHTLQIGTQEANALRAIDFESVSRPASIPAGQSVRAGALTAIPASAVSQFVDVLFFEK